MARNPSLFVKVYDLIATKLVDTNTVDTTTTVGVNSAQDPSFKIYERFDGILVVGAAFKTANIVNAGGVFTAALGAIVSGYHRGNLNLTLGVDGVANQENYYPCQLNNAGRIQMSNSSGALTIASGITVHISGTLYPEKYNEPSIHIWGS